MAINEHPKHHYNSEGDDFAAVKPSHFNLSLYIWHITNGLDLQIDCRGTAAAVAALANLQGANLYSLSMANSNGTNIRTNEFLPFASTDWVQFPNWSFHEVAAVKGTLLDAGGGFLGDANFTPLSVPLVPWPAGAGSEQIIYDAIPTLNRPVPLRAIKIPLGVAGPNGRDYRWLLISTGAGDDVTAEHERELI